MEATCKRNEAAKGEATNRNNIVGQKLTPGCAVTLGISVEKLSSVSVPVWVEQCTGEKSCCQPSKKDRDNNKGPRKIGTTRQQEYQCCQETMNQPFRRSKDTAEIHCTKLARAPIIQSDIKQHENEPEQFTADNTSAKYIKMRMRKGHQGKGTKILQCIGLDFYSSFIVQKWPARSIAK